MAFINISDPRKRKEIVEEYIKTRNVDASEEMISSIVDPATAQVDQVA